MKTLFVLVCLSIFVVGCSKVTIRYQVIEKETIADCRYKKDAKNVVNIYKQYNPNKRYEIQKLKIK